MYVELFFCFKRETAYWMRISDVSSDVCSSDLAATPEQWNGWRWQLRNRIRSQAHLERVFELSADEQDAISRHKGALPVGITPYYASLMSRDDAEEPLRRTHIPVGQEYLRTPGEADDPLGEDHDTKIPGLVHRYPDRVLFLTTGFCSTYCRRSEDPPSEL